MHSLYVFFIFSRKCKKCRDENYSHSCISREKRIQTTQSHFPASNSQEEIFWAPAVNSKQNSFLPTFFKIQKYFLQKRERQTGIEKRACPYRDPCTTHAECECDEYMKCIADPHGDMRCMQMNIHEKSAATFTKPPGVPIPTLPIEVRYILAKMCIEENSDDILYCLENYFKSC